MRNAWVFERILTQKEEFRCGQESNSSIKCVCECHECAARREGHGRQPRMPKTLILSPRVSIASFHPSLVSQSPTVV